MYFRRHCYDKMHRCPGWAGGGFRYPFHVTKPDDWNDEDYGPFETSNLRKRHWWQQSVRCKGGTLWQCAVDMDPWRSFRFHRCTKCDVVAVPHVLRLLDPFYVWWDLRTGMRNWWIDRVRDHKRRWVGETPWWSLPDSLWRGVRSWWFSRRYGLMYWIKRLNYWYSPGHRAEREKDIAQVKAHYGIKV